jgi:preprotein translocase subunit SecF
MEFLAFLDKIPSGVNTVFILAIAGISAYVFFKKSNSGADNATIQSLNRQLETQGKELNTLTERLDTYDKRNLELVHLLGEKEGIIKTKDQQLQQYEEIFKNRNPELVEVLNRLVTFMEKLDKKIDNNAEEGKKVAKEMTEELKTQTVLLKNTEKRNNSIDKAHAQTVDILRRLEHEDVDGEKTVTIRGKIKEDNPQPLN